MLLSWVCRGTGLTDFGAELENHSHIVKDLFSLLFERRGRGLRLTGCFIDRIGLKVPEPAAKASSVRYIYWFLGMGCLFFGFH